MTARWPAAKYSDLSWCEEYAGHPFVEALGEPLAPKAIAAAFRHLPPVSTAAAAHIGVQRAHLASCIRRIHVPSTSDVAVVSRLDILIRQGYVDRHPLKPGYGHYLYGAEKRLAGPLPSITASPCLLLLGPSGVGKSTVLKRYVSFHPAVIAHGDYDGSELNHLQLPVIYLEAPFNGTPRGLVLEFFSVIDRRIGSNYFKEYENVKNVQTLLIMMAQLCATFSVGLIIVDEAQNFLVYNNRDEVQAFLVKLMNGLGVPLVFAGTYRVTRLFENCQQLARRLCSESYLEISIPQNAADEVWRRRIKALWAYQWVTHPLPFTSDVYEWYFGLTQAVPSIDVLLFYLVQQRAALTEAKTVTKEDFERVFRDSMQPVHAALRALAARDTNPTWFEEYEDLWPSKIALAGLFSGTANLGAARPGASPSAIAARAPATKPKLVPAPKKKVAGTDGALDPGDLRRLASSGIRLQLLKDQGITGVGE